MNIWRLMTHHLDQEKALAWSQQQQRIAIGWGQVGDISAHGYTSSEEISQAIKGLFHQGKHPYKNWGQGGVCLWDFYVAMKQGDLVILNTKRGPSLVVEVTGDYQCVTAPPNLPDYRHQRTVKLSGWNPKDLWKRAGARPIAGHNSRWTLIQCTESLSEELRNPPTEKK